MKKAKPRKRKKILFKWSLEDELLRAFRLFVLEQCFGNKTLAADVLGLSIRSYQTWLNEYSRQGFFVMECTMRQSKIKVSKNLLGEFYGLQAQD
jgi:hypothetical protein